MEPVRPLLGLIEAEPLISPQRLKLCRWLSHYYLSPLFDALSLCLPPGFERRALACLKLAGGARPDISGLSDAGRRAAALLEEKDSLTLEALEKALGRAGAREAAASLLAGGYAVKSFDLAPARVKPKTELYASLAAGPGEAEAAVSALNNKRAFRQAALLTYLMRCPDAVPLTELRQAGFGRPLLNALAASRLVNIEAREIRRQPIDYRRITPSSPFEPTPAQRRAIESINAAISAAKPEVFLLHGVTGSGKTEVYLQALGHALARGRQGIVLVPEIALTPQTVERFAARFPRRVAVLHSGLTLGEQYDAWRDIKAGRYDVVVGARSALFAPLPRLGLIVMDEEHEWTYKQVDHTPRYHARTAALKLAELGGATLVLGSATPDVESYHRAETGQYRLLELPERLTPHPGAPLPAVRVVDLRAELKSGNRSIFSRDLLDSARRAVASGEQVILFFNRRGSSSIVQCRTCGYVVSCPRCNVALSYHSAEASLVCHQCNLRRRPPEVCPACRGRRIRFLGLGTQKVMEEAAACFPGARLLRWDSDAARSRLAHEEILAKMRRREADILVGTQMVAKGLDLPQVTLVGVVSADTALNLPDIRSGERTFQLLSQVAGRAGRGERPGQVVIQSYAPAHYAIAAAAGHDYAAFYRQEIELRRALYNPPFSRLARLTFSHLSEVAARREADRLKKALLDEMAARGAVDVSLIGPAPAFIPRLRGRYRWQLLLKGREPAELLRGMSLPQGWVADVDPVGLS